MKILTHLRILFVISVGVILAIAAYSPAVAKNPEGGEAAVSSEGQMAAPLPAVKATIEKKRHEWAITNVGERYRVTLGTIIVGPDNQQISLANMPVPCEAEIIYSTQKGVRSAHRIRILYLGRNANNHFTKDMVE